MVKVTQNQAIAASVVGVGLALSTLLFRQQAVRIGAIATAALVPTIAWGLYFNRGTDRYFDTKSNRDWFVANGTGEGLKPHLDKLNTDEFLEIVKRFLVEKQSVSFLETGGKPEAGDLIRMAGDRFTEMGIPSMAGKWALGELFRREPVTPEDRIEGLRTFLAKEDGLTENWGYRRDGYQDLKLTVMNLLKRVSEKADLAHEPLTYLSDEVGDKVRDFCREQWTMVWENFKPGESEVASRWELEKMVELGQLTDADLVKMATQWREGKTERSETEEWAFYLLFEKKGVSIAHLKEAMDNFVSLGDEIKDKAGLLREAAGVIESFVKLQEPNLDDEAVKALIRLPLNLGTKNSYLDEVWFKDKVLREQFKAILND